MMDCFTALIETEKRQLQIVPERAGALLPAADHHGHLHHEPGGLPHGQAALPPQDRILWVSLLLVKLDSKASNEHREDYAKFYNHREGP